MKHIVFSGQMGAGKDEIANMTCVLSDFGPIWSRSAFAGAVKDIYCNAFNVDRAFIEEYKRNPEPPPGFQQTVRKSLQFIGDGFRQIQSNVWIDIALRNPDHVIISDGRYINEAKVVKKAGGINILVWRPGFENDDPNPSESQILPIVRYCLETNQNGPIRTHSDEGPFPQGIEWYDYFFRNDVSLDELRGKVKKELIPWLRDRYNNRRGTDARSSHSEK